MTRRYAGGDRAPVDLNRAHYVYRAFDGYGLLLYVGCTLDPDSRLSAHRSSSAWHRFAESIGVTDGGWDFSAARRREREAIDVEAPYFNSSVADMKRTQANIVSARRNLYTRFDPEPRFAGPPEAIDEHNPRWMDYCAASEAWRRRHEVERALLKVGAFPYLTDADRLSRYLTAREGAALSFPERAA